jgi:uncharacterized membrane protein
MAAHAANAATFQGLGFLPNARFSRPTAISADGSTVVGYSDEPFRWTATTGLQAFTGGDIPNAVNADGSVIVGVNGDHAFRWTSAGGAQDLGVLPGDTHSAAMGVSADGAIVVGNSAENDDGGGTMRQRAVRWTPSGGMRDLSGPSSLSDASAISADGSTIVGNHHRWTSSTGWQPVGPFHPNAVNKDGTCIVGTEYSTGGIGDLKGDTGPLWWAWRWTAHGGATQLFSGMAASVSSDGSIIAGTIVPIPTPPPPQWRAGIWDAAHGMRDLRDLLTHEYHLDLSGWTLQQSVGISADGLTIIGYGTNPDGNTEGWIAVIPEPAALGSAGLAAIGLMRLRVRRRNG